MKITRNAIAVVAAGLLLVSARSATALSGVNLSIQGSDVLLRWPSGSCQTFVIGYRPTLDPSTPWTFLETAYAATSGTETTYLHHNVVALQAPLSADSGTVRAPSPPLAVIRERAQATAQYLLTMLKEAIARAEADRKAWKEEGKPLAGAAPDTPAVAQPPLGSMGFYFVADYAEDSDGDGLSNSIELVAGLNMLSADSDGDSILDGDEDSDGDGVSNFNEALSGTLINEPDSEYPPPLLLFGTVFFIEENFTLSCEPGGALAPAAATSQDLLFLDAAADMAHGITAVETSSGVLDVKLHSIYIGPALAAFSPQAANPPQNPFPRPSADQMKLLTQANGQTDIGSGRIGNVSQELYDQLTENTLDWARWEAERGLRNTERLVQEIESGQRQASAALRRSLRANLVTQAKRLSSATSSLARRFGRAVGRYLPFLGGILILSSASAIAQDWQTAFENYAADIRNGDDTTGSAAILAALSNDLAPGSGNFVLNYLLR